MIVTDNGKTYLILPPPAAQIMRKLHMITHTKTKVPTDVRRKRNVAHERATELWAVSRYLSPIGGLGELVRGDDMPVPAHVRAANRAAFKRRNAESVAQNTRRVEYKPKGSDRYFPHQGPREIARRAKQMEAAATKNGIGHRYGAEREAYIERWTSIVTVDAQQLSASMMSHAMLVEAAEDHVAQSHGIDLSSAPHPLDVSEGNGVFVQQPDGSLTVEPIDFDVLSPSPDPVPLTADDEAKHLQQLAKRRERDRARRAIAKGELS